MKTLYLLAALPAWIVIGHFALVLALAAAKVGVLRELFGAPLLVTIALLTMSAAWPRGKKEENGARY